MAKNIFRSFTNNMSGYYLISKIEKLPYSKYKGNALRLINQAAMTVDEIVVGNKSNPKLIRKITTFKNSNGQIFERVMDFSDKPYRNRIYTVRDNVIGQDEFVTSTHIKEYTLPRNLKDTHLQFVEDGFKRTLFWSPAKYITNHLSENINTGEKILSQITQTNLLKPTKETHTFIEFPHIINKKISKAAKKILKFSVNTFNGYKVNPKNIYEQGTTMPKNDSYLGIRALDINDAKTALTEKFLIERGLRNKRIKINPEYLPENNDEELIKAMFNPADGCIDFIKGYIFKSKSELCATARHETEHGWQFYLHSRNTGGTTPWEEQIYNLFKDLPKSLKKEAQEYTESIRSYVTVAENREEYRKNLIEIKANEVGHKEKVLYDYERAEIQKEFPHIPQELL